MDKKELKKQAMQAGKLVAGFLGKDLDKDSQWFLGVQRDGKGHMLHVHVALNSVLTTGKVLNTNVLRLLDREKDDVKEKGLRTRINEYLEDNFQDITGRPYKPVEPSNENLVNHKEIHVNDRICQFRIVENQPKLNFVEVEHLTGKDRSGFGSTGIS